MSKTCYACTHSYMEPDSPLICGAPSAGAFGKSIYDHKTQEHCDGGKEFKQHPYRNEDGSLKREPILTPPTTPSNVR